MVSELATDAERKRFREAYRGNIEKSEAALRKYLHWRKESLPVPESKLVFGRGIIPFLQLLKDKSGKYARTKKTNCRIMWMWGAMYDPNIDDDDCALCTAQFIDDMLDRDSLEKVTVIIDTRPGTGEMFKNPNAWAIVNFAKKCSTMFSLNFPERLFQVILFPMPWYARAIWAVVRPFLDVRTADKVVMLDGKVAVGAALPKGMWDYIDDGVVPENPTTEAYLKQEMGNGENNKSEGLDASGDGAGVDGSPDTDATDQIVDNTGSGGHVGMGESSIDGYLVKGNAERGTVIERKHLRTAMEVPSPLSVRA